MYFKYNANCEDGNKVLLDYFNKVKPFWVVKPKISDRETTLCKEHENFKLILRKLSRLHIINESNGTKFISSICCDIENEDCMYRQCKECIFIIL